MHKIFKAQITAFGSQAVVIVTAFQNPRGYYKGESFCVFPAPRAGQAFTEIKFDHKTFPGSPADLNISSKLNASGAALTVERDLIDANLKSALERCSLPAVLSELSYKSAKLTDGQGTNRLVELINGFEKHNGIG